MKTQNRLKMNRAKRGFTLVELMVASSVMTMLVAGTVSIMYVHEQSWYTAAVASDTSRDASSALERLVYGAGSHPGLRATHHDLTSVTNLSDGSWILSTSPGDFVAFDATSGTITNQDGALVCDNVSTSTATLGSQGLTVTLNVQARGGRQTMTSAMRTYVQFRN